MVYLTMRMSIRRFIRFTNRFSKKIENLEAAVAPRLMCYHFSRIHETLRVIPGRMLFLFPKSIQSISNEILSNQGN